MAISGDQHSSPDGQADLLEAIKRGDAETVAALLDEHPALVDARGGDGVSALSTALYWHRAAIADLLLARGAQDDIFSAAARGDLIAVEMALDADPDALNRFSPDGWTPLALAAHFGSTDAAHHLLVSGADVNAVSQHRLANTPLHAAVAGKQPEMVALLLENGAEIDAVDANGFTPLALAADAGDGEMVRRLLAAGADPAIPNEAGETPVAVATRRQHGEIAALLREHAAG